MADHYHRRAVSEVEASHQSLAPGAVYGHQQVNRHLPEKRNDTSTSSKTNASLHFRSQSHESPYSYSLRGREPVTAPAPRRSRYGDLLSAETAQVYTRHMQLSQLDMQRRSSESSTSSDSTSSAVSNCTAVARDSYSWSASTTPEAMSPTSPKNSFLLHSPTDKTALRNVPFSQAPPASPSKLNSRASVSSQPAWPHACSQSTPRRLPSSSLEPLRSDKDEQVGSRLRNTRGHAKTASHQERSLDVSLVPAAPLLRTAKSVANLRQRRQQKADGTPQAKQPPRLRLSPLPPLPQDQQHRRSSSTVSPRTLTPSRSLPQLRNAAGPPPTGPLPPLPNMPNMPTTSFRTPLKPSSPLPSPDMCSQTPCSAGPLPPPSRPPPESPGFAASPMPGHQPPEQQSPWEEELRRHKKLLEQFPSQPENGRELPRLSRTHRSLGNIRARSRSLSRAMGHSLHGDAPISESQLPVHASSFSLRGLKTQRPSTAKSAKDTAAYGEHATSPQPGMPHISIFEDDSEEEGDPVRRFVRNLFTRRSRSAEVPASNQPTLEPAQQVLLSSRQAADSIKSLEVAGRGDGSDVKSSAFTSATNLEAGAATSTTAIAAAAVNGNGRERPGIDNLAKRGKTPSPTILPSDPIRQHQKGPLLSRMFVRRSH